MTRNSRIVFVTAVAAAVAAATAVAVEHAHGAPAHPDAQIVAKATS